jgi:dihydrofolate synthase/folylpolyglutamate synthase
MNDIDQEYQDTLDYLFSFIDFSIQRSFRYAPEMFDLARMHELLESLGNPHKQYPIIHVAGTKGKGSVTAMCASALQAANYTVGIYTSPHLVDYTERIQINSNPIPQAELVSLVEEIKPYIESIPRITTFEISTALAFYYFYKMNVGIAVVEVGLGGRLDATNVVIPEVSVITSVSLDHTDILGETLAEIAAEKAGIIKPGVPVVLSPQKENAGHIITQIASERIAPLILVGRDIRFERESHALDGQVFLIWAEEDQALANDYFESGGVTDWIPTRLKIPLLGQHQVENAATAYTALQVVNRSGIKISETEIRHGFKNVTWPGRFEILRENPPIVIDSAHNRDSALKLRLTLDEYFSDLPVILVFGASEDKDVYGMFTELLPRIRQVVAVKSIHPRAMEPETISEIAQEFGRPLEIIPDVFDGFEEALQMAGQEAVVLVTGSIFVVAGARIAWDNLRNSKN